MAKIISIIDEKKESTSCQAGPQQYPSNAIIRHHLNLKKILLIQPPAFSNNSRSDMNPNAPLGLGYIAAMLEKNNFEVKILDAFIEGWDQEVRINHEKIRVGLSFEKIKEIIIKERPDVVGITSMFTCQRKNAHEVAKIVKEVDSDIVVIFGGAHPTSAPEMVMEDFNVDVAVLAEGDNLIVSLIKHIEENKNLNELDGLAYRDINNNLVSIQKVTQIDDLDEIPFPARHLLPMEKYFAAGVRHGGSSRGLRAASMITSRGCAYKCNFCTAFKVFTRKTRMRSIENVLMELDELVKKYKVDEIFFEDDQIIAKQRRTGDLFDAISSRFNLHWDTPNGVSPWLLNDEILEKMKKSGCYRVNIAIESGNQWVLDNIINKPVKVDKIPEVVRLIRKHGMEVGTYLVVGNIGHNHVETIEQIKESFKFCRKLRVHPHASLLTAYPGSEVLQIAQNKGYLVPGFDWDNLIIQKFQIQTPLWTPEEIISLVNKEMMKSRWWLLLTSPFSSIRIFLTLLAKNPLSTLKKLYYFFTKSLLSFQQSV